MSVTEILEAVRALSPEERSQVKALIDSLPSSDELQMSEDEFERHLAAKGIITNPTPMTEEERAIAQAAFDAYEPVEVGGIPISQMIIEERR